MLESFLAEYGYIAILLGTAFARLAALPLECPTCHQFDLPF